MVKKYPALLGKERKIKTQKYCLFYIVHNLLGFAGICFNAEEYDN